MQCARCTGMKVPELITEGGTKAWTLRCISCGDITDGVIIINRRRQRHRPDGRARTPVYGSRKWDRADSRLLSLDQ
jgi:hypothetical protein